MQACQIRSCHLDGLRGHLHRWYCQYPSPLRLYLDLGTSRHDQHGQRDSTKYYTNGIYFLPH